MELMIDLETLGTHADSVVLQIGAVFFDIQSGALGPKFEAKLNIDSQIRRNRTVTGSTLDFWMKQGVDAKKDLFTATHDPSVVLQAFIKYYNQYPKTTVWGNGSSFDVSIMESLYKDYELESPWEFYFVNDLRTFKRFVAKGAKVEGIGIKHHALDDAIAQANYVIKHARS